MTAPSWETADRRHWYLKLGAVIVFTIEPDGDQWRAKGCNDWQGPESRGISACDAWGMVWDLGEAHGVEVPPLTMVDDEKAAPWVLPVNRITAEITAVGSESRTCVDDEADAVDAEVCYGGVHVGDLTLVENPILEPRSLLWGANVDGWPDHQLQVWLDGRDDVGFHAAITAAVREARELLPIAA